jgi:spore coat protein A
LDDPPDPQTNGQVMQFRVNLPLQGMDTSFDPVPPRATLRGGRDQPPAIVRLALPRLGAIAPGVTVSKRRQIILNEVEGEGGPIEVLVNNTKWDGRRESTGNPIPGFKPDGRGNWLSELPQVGSTELWQIINFTDDAHPMHLHLVQFQLLNRQKIDADRYLDAWSAAFPVARLSRDMVRRALITSRTPISRSGATRRCPRFSKARGCDRTQTRPAGRTRSKASPGR